MNYTIILIIIFVMILSCSVNTNENYYDTYGYFIDGPSDNNDDYIYEGTPSHKLTTRPYLYNYYDRPKFLNMHRPQYIIGL
jgi:hypothetical protein